MKLQSIAISEVLGLSRADINFGGVTLVAGDNAVGKSTLADCISMALLGTPSRVSAKKDLAQLLRDNAAKGRITISYEDGEGTAEFRLPKGEHHASEFPGMQFLPFVLRPSKFAELDADQRRTLLFQLTNCKASSKIIIQKLVERGIDESLATDFAINWKTGFPAAAKEAYARGTTAKGAWGQITGQKWGSIVAEDWKAPTPEGKCPTEAELQAIMAEHEKVAAEVEKGQQYVGGLEAKREASASYVQRKQAVEELAGQLERRQAKKAATEKDLSEREAELPAMVEELATLQAGAIPVACPCCGEQLRINGGTLDKFQGLKADTKLVTDLALRVRNMKDAIELLKRTLSNDIASVAEAVSAGKQLESILAEQIEVIDEAKIQQGKDALAGQKAKANTLRAEFNAKQQARIDFSKVAEKTEQAAKAHAEVKTWLAVGDALSPDGIPADLLADAIAPFNQSLAAHASLCGWKSPEVQADMTLTYGGRLYGLCSASEKWRADALFALAIAQISQLKLVVLDGFDILHAAARQELLGMCCQLEQMKSMETIILCGTMKELPPASALAKRGVTGVWIAKGIAENQS
jgi:energy-coupling factor transporter ATP-binding protein EcfA2